MTNTSDDTERGDDIDYTQTRYNGLEFTILVQLVLHINGGGQISKCSVATIFYSHVKT